MGGKIEGWESPDSRPIPLFIYDCSDEQLDKITHGLDKMKLPFIAIDNSLFWNAESVSEEVCVAAGINAMKNAKTENYKEIYTIPAIDLWLPEQPEYKGLGVLVAEKLSSIANAVAAGKLVTTVNSSSTSPSIPTTSIRSTPYPKNINPREAGLPFPTDTLAMDEIRNLFKDKYSQDKPFIFSSGGAEVAIYPEHTPGDNAIEFTLDEFYAILKVIEITKAEGIMWRIKEDASPE